MNKGFSLIETLVATAIIVMATVGPLALAASSLAQANYIKDQIVATFLAQEALEIMRNVRDTSGITEIKRLADGTGGVSCGVGSVCTVSGIDTSGVTYAVTGCQDTCPALEFDTENDLYCYTGHGGADCPGVRTSSIFTRTVNVERVNDGKEYKIHATVRWARGYGERHIELTENLFERTW